MISTTDRLVERYLDGRMSPAEERRFRHRLEEDEQLVETLRTELLIRSTMAGELGSMHADHSRSRARAMALLAAMPGGAGQATAVSGAGSGGTLSGLAGIKGIVALLAAAAVAAGSYVALLPAKAPTAPPASRVEPAPDPTRMPPQPAPILAEPPATIPHTAPTVEREGPEAGMPARSATPRIQPEPKEPVRAQDAETPAVLQKAGPEGTLIQERRAATLQAAEEPPVTIRNDTLRTRLKIEPMQRP